MDYYLTTNSSLQLYSVFKKSGTNGNFIYYLHYMLYMFTPTLCAFSQPLFHVCADFAQHIGIDSSTRVCNTQRKVSKISDFNSIHLWLQESPKCEVQGVKVRWSWCPLHWASPPNPSVRKYVIEPMTHCCCVMRRSSVLNELFGLFPNQIQFWYHFITEHFQAIITMDCFFTKERSDYMSVP
jgi:hypothetical protein